MDLTEKEMLKVDGGAITSQLINAISKAINTIYDLGEKLGSSIRRAATGNYCSIR